MYIAADARQFSPCRWPSLMLWSSPPPVGGSAEVSWARLRRRLPEKIAADPAGRLVFFGFTDIGVLNNVVELWRYPSAQASIRCEWLVARGDFTRSFVSGTL